MRVIRDCGPLFSELEKFKFYSCSVWCLVSLSEWKLFSLPFREVFLILLLYLIIVLRHHSSPLPFLDALFFTKFHLNLTHTLILSNGRNVLISRLGRISFQQPIPL